MKNWLNLIKNWLKRYGIGCLFIVAGLFNLYNSVRHLQSNRSEFDVVYRWEVSSFVLGLILLMQGIAELFEANGKKRFARIFSIICSSILLVFGLITMFIFDSNIGFFGDVIMMVGLPIFIIVMSVIKLKSKRKDIFTMRQLKAIDIVLAFIIFLIITWIILLFTFRGV